MSAYRKYAGSDEFNAGSDAVAFAYRHLDRATARRLADAVFAKFIEPAVARVCGSVVSNVELRAAVHARCVERIMRDWSRGKAVQRQMLDTVMRYCLADELHCTSKTLTLDPEFEDRLHDDGGIREAASSMHVGQVAARIEGLGSSGKALASIVRAAGEGHLSSPEIARVTGMTEGRIRQHKMTLRDLLPVVDEGLARA